MQWSGFRKVRRQVCKRVHRRIHELQLSGFQAYRKFLETSQEEWELLDSYCRITISRFYRDHVLYDYLGTQVLPQYIHAHPQRDQYTCLSLGCASGEEPYTMAILWKQAISDQFPGKSLRIIAMDLDPVLLERAEKAAYSAASLRELPAEWRESAFTREEEMFVLKPGYKGMVEFVQADIRKHRFTGSYQIVCCRNLVATYYSPALQVLLFRKIRKAMTEGAILLLGTHEALPDGVHGFRRDSRTRQIYRAVSH